MCLHCIAHPIPPYQINTYTHARTSVCLLHAHRLIHQASGRSYNIYFNPPKAEGKDDVRASWFLISFCCFFLVPLPPWGEHSAPVGS